MKNFKLSFVALLAFFGLLISGCGGTEGLFANAADPQINQCVNVTYIPSQQSVGTTTTLTTVYLRASNTCQNPIFFQFCVDYQGAGVVSDPSVNYNAICGTTASNVIDTGVPTAGANYATIQAGQYSDFYLYSTPIPVVNNVSYALVQQFVNSKIYTFSALQNFSCTASFQVGRGYVLQGSCAKLSTAS